MSARTGSEKENASKHLRRHPAAPSLSVVQHAAKACTVRAMSRSSRPLARSLSFSLSAVLGLRCGSVAPGCRQGRCKRLQITGLTMTVATCMRPRPTEEPRPTVQHNPQSPAGRSSCCTSERARREVKQCNPRTVRIRSKALPTPRRAQTGCAYGLVYVEASDLCSLPLRR